MSKPLIAVLLSGCGVHDGSEIHEAVLTLFNIDKEGGEYICIAPDMEQHHVINHITGEEMKEKRNVLIEAARIARGKIKSLSQIKADDFDALIMPGGFGAAKNLTKWAFNGHEGEIHPDVKRIIIDFIDQNKPIAAFCMSATVVAKALKNTKYNALLTVGSVSQPSEYNIADISSNMEAAGAVAAMTTVDDIVFDEKLKLISSPCYMMDATVYEINFGIMKAIKKLIKLIK